MMSLVITAICALCVGIIIMAIIADRTNRSETEKLRQQIDNDSRNYLRCVSQMQSEIDELHGKVNMERQVVASLKIENAELRACLERQHCNAEKTTISDV